MAETPSMAPLYEPPRIERVMTPEDLAREVMYSGPGLITVDEPT